MSEALLSELIRAAYGVRPYQGRRLAAILLAFEDPSRELHDISLAHQHRDPVFSSAATRLRVLASISS